MGEVTEAQGEETLPESRSKSVQNRDETRSLPQHPFCDIFYSVMTQQTCIACQLCARSSAEPGLQT